MVNKIWNSSSEIGTEYWNNPANWIGGIVPNSGSDVSIGSGSVPYQIVINAGKLNTVSSLSLGDGAGGAAQLSDELSSPFTVVHNTTLVSSEFDVDAGATALLQGAVSVDTNSSIFDGGYLSTGALTNAGDINVKYGSLSVNGNISGSGTINITRAGTVEITGSATGTIAFGDGFADTLLLDTSDTSFSGTITGLRGGNSIDLTSLSWAVGDKTAYNATTHVLDIRNGAGTNVFQFNNISSSSGTFTVTSDGSGGTLLSPGAGGGGGIIIDPPCFLAGTRILTDRGEVVVEDLLIGDLVVTASGVGQPVQWIGRRAYISRRVEADRRAAVLPIRIMAGALDDNLPVRDLLLSPDHALLVDGVLIQAGAMVDATTIQREDNVPAIFTYYHVELADHALILAEGVPAETFVDNIDRMAFDNWDEYLALYPEGRAITEMPLPRAKSHRQVPMATRGRLAARAASLLSQAAIAA